MSETSQGYYAAYPEEEELVAATPTQRNWRGILISLLVIGAVSSLIVTCVILLTPPHSGPRITGRLVSLEDVVQSRYQVIPDGAAWVTGEDLVFRDDNGGVSVVNARTHHVTVLIKNDTMRQHSIERFLVSPDLKSVIIFGPEKKITEYTSEAKCWLWDVEIGPAELRPEPWTVDQSHPSLQHVTWVSGGRGAPSALVMVHRGDIFYKRRAVSPDSYRVTKNAAPGRLQNAIPDVLYAEHILRSSHAIWPSPGGTLLLYFTFNSSLVDDLHYTEYHSTAQTRYPRLHSVKYPRAGATNPTVTITIANVSNPSTADMFTERGRYHALLPPSSLAQRQLYAAGVRWLDDRQVTVTWYSRRQNTSYVTLCSAPTWTCHTVYQSAAARGGWVPVTPAPVFPRDSVRRPDAAVLLDRAASGPDPLHTHIMMIGTGNHSRSVIQMTHGNIDVHEILAWHRGFIYYISGLASSPAQRHLYRVSDQTSPLTLEPQCLTCPAEAPHPASQTTDPTPVRDATTANDDPTARNSSDCHQYEALVSSAGHLALRCVGPAIPQLFVQLSVNGSSRQLVRNSTQLRQLAHNTSLPAVSVRRVVLRSGAAAAVRLHVPPEFRAGDAAAYPLLLRLVAPPADHRWRVDHATYLSSRHSFVVADVSLPEQQASSGASQHDLPPGVGRQEVAALKEVIHNLTSLEYVSPARVVALGAGFGGYLALSLLAATDKELRCGVALAPITNWELYASAAAERRLGLPDENPRGYWDSNLGHRAHKLAGRRALLVHGTGDTSVGIQHTFLLSAKLEKSATVFRQMIYPDEDHRLSGVRHHLLRTLDQYFHECFLPDNIKELVLSEDI